MFWTLISIALAIIGAYAVIAATRYVYLRRVKEMDRLKARKQAAKWGVHAYKAIRKRFSGRSDES